LCGAWRSEWGEVWGQLPDCLLLPPPPLLLLPPPPPLLLLLHDGLTKGVAFQPGADCRDAGPNRRRDTGPAIQGAAHARLRYPAHIQGALELVSPNPDSTPTGPSQSPLLQPEAVSTPCSSPARAGRCNLPHVRGAATSRTCGALQPPARAGRCTLPHGRGAATSRTCGALQPPARAGRCSHVSRTFPLYGSLPLLCHSCPLPLLSRPACIVTALLACKVQSLHCVFV
jgi:hypothetical protein